MISPVSVRRFGTVTSKVQKRREQYIRNMYPEYRGNNPDSSPDTTSRRGRRLGGSFVDPSRPILKLDGSEEFYDSDTKRELEESFVAKLSHSHRDPTKLTKVLNDYQEALDSYTSNKEPISAERDRIIKSMSSLDYQVLSGKSQAAVPGAHHRRILEKNKFATVSFTQGDTEEVQELTPSSVRVDTKKPKPKKPSPSKVSDTPTFPIIREEQDMFPEISFRLNKSVMTDTFVNLSLPMIDVNGSSVPSVVTSTTDEYNRAKIESILFDVSYKRRFTISGSDSVLAMDHFISAPIRNLHIGDAINACILDTKGYILATCLVSRLSPNEYSVIIDGSNPESVFRYMAQYIVYSRQSGLEVHLRAHQSGGTFLLVGPASLPNLINSIGEEQKIFLGTHIGIPPHAHLSELPSMCTISTNFLEITRLIGDQFILSFRENEESASFLNSLAPFGGAYALDMLRMESGEIRASSDIPASTTPISASLSHLVDQRKVRERILFGHERIAKELLKQPTHRRVGIVASKYAYAGCRILSAPHRAPIGELTSCAWSPLLKKRVCQAYIKPEYAVENNPVLINLPHEIPESIDYRFRRRIVKQGNLQSVFRRLIPAKVVAFPIRPLQHDEWYNADEEQEEDRE